MSIRYARAGLSGLAIALVPLGQSLAHEIVGNRFFPATLGIDDPGVNDELAFPTVSSFKTGDDPSFRQRDFSGEFAKRITEAFAISVNATYSRLSPPGGPTGMGANGFQNLETTFKYRVLKDPAHEFVMSVGLSVEWGGSGAQSVGAHRGAHLAVQTRGRDTELVEARDLIHHQRDERRHDDGEATVDDAGDPVADALPRAGRRYEENVSACFCGGNDVSLSRTEVREAEGLLEYRASPRRGLDRDSVLLLVERQRAGVHAVALSGGRRPVGEDVAEVAAAFLAADLRPGDEHAPVTMLLNGVRIHRLVEARPARAGVELRVGAEELRAAPRAAIDAGGVDVHVLAGECSLGARFAEDRILLRRQALTPLFVGEGDLLVHRG